MQQAMKATLGGLPVHALSSDLHVIPLLLPEPGLPFAVALQLHYHSNTASWSSSAEAQDLPSSLLSLTYVLRGAGQAQPLKDTIVPCICASGLQQGMVCRFGMSRAWRSQCLEATVL